MPGSSVKIPMIAQRTETPLMGVDGGVTANTRTAEALQQAGSVVENTAEEWQHRVNQAAVKQADTARKEVVTNLLWGDDGLFSKSGEDFLNALPRARDELRKARERAGSGLKNEAQRTLYKQVADSDGVDLDRQIGAYAQRAQKQYLNDASVGRQAQAEQDYQRLYNLDPEGAEKAWNTVRSEIVGRADINGDPPELTQSAITKARSDALQRVITAQYVSDPVNGPAKARQTLERERGNLDPLIAADLDQKIRGAETQVEAKGLTQVFRGDGSVQALIRNQAADAGVDPDQALTIALLENPALNAGAKNPRSSAHGLFQIIDGTWEALGGGDRASVERQVELGVKNIAQTRDQLRSGLGRAPQPWEVYLGHQQGVGGALKLLQHPEASAVDLVGRDAVVNNGGRPNMTAGEFATIWKQKYAGASQAAAKLTTSAPDLATRIDIARAMAGGDPERERTFVAVVKDDYDLQERFRDDAQKANAEAVLRYAETATSETQVPPNLWQALTPEQRDQFRGVISSNAKGERVATDPATYANLAGLYATDPKGFARIDPMQFVSKLSRSDFQQVVGWRTQVIQAGAPRPAERLSITTAMEVSSRLLKAAQVKDSKDIAKFQGSLMARMQAFEATHNRPATEADVMQMARMLLREGSDKPGGRNSVRAYQVEGDFYDRIPDKAERQITEALRAKLKREPSHAEVMDRYRRGVAVGLFQ